jgi:hypothetical protein
MDDHLAGANFAIELLQISGNAIPLARGGAVATAIVAEVQRDRKVLEGIIERVGQPDGLSAFEALETLDLESWAKCRTGAP